MKADEGTERERYVLADQQRSVDDDHGHLRRALDAASGSAPVVVDIVTENDLRALAREPVLPEVLQAYHLDHLEFGPDYIIPKPFDPRLMDFVPPAVAQAAVDSGVARGDFPKHYKPAPQR